VEGAGVSGLAQLEAYVDARELARLLGVSTRTVSRWTREGMPSQTWGMRARRYQPSVAAAWAAKRGMVVAQPTNPARRLMSAQAPHREE
jgi:phage terminase Nu1 subunit (DNA packaging protein)